MAPQRKPAILSLCLALVATACPEKQDAPPPRPPLPAQLEMPVEVPDDEPDDEPEDAQLQADCFDGDPDACDKLGH